jgi:hypothetical protein
VRSSSCEKGGRPITKPIPDELNAIIRAADEQRVWASPDDYLIPNRRSHRNRERFGQGDLRHGDEGR